MQALSSLNLVINALLLIITSSFVGLLFWYDRSRSISQFLAITLIFVTLWNMGTLITQVLQLLSVELASQLFPRALIEIGFNGASIAIYGFTSLAAGLHTRRFRYLSLFSLVLVVFYYAFLIVIDNNNEIITASSPQTPSSILSPFYFIFAAGALWIAARYRRKINSSLTVIGILLFTLGQGMTFINPQIPISTLSTSVSSSGLLLISLALVHSEMLQPLRQRSTQVEDIHHATLAISSRLAVNTVLNEISSQAAEWTEADAVAILLKQQDRLELVSSYGFPDQSTRYSIPLDDTVTGRSITNRETIYIENYQRDWEGIDDLPYAQETFGSVISVPLEYSNQVIGALLVIGGQHSRLLRREQVFDLEHIAAQAAIAIGHSRLFEAVAVARTQLETVLESTDNLILAVDRKLSLIFINSAARQVFQLNEKRVLEKAEFALIIQRVLQQNVSHLNINDLTKSLIRGQKTVVELEYDHRTYLCHLSTIGKGSIEGFVAVFNEITSLKELDRMKSEMIRMASHDLKNPLMGAMLYVDLAREQSIETGEALSVIETQLERMHRIIRGVLDLEQVRQGLQKKSICDAQVIATTIWQDLRRMAAEKRITLELNMDENQNGYKFLGDGNQIERALINLVENAIKFTDFEGNVRIEVWSAHSQIHISVEDNGVGVPKEIQSRIFERFFRGSQKGVEHVSGSGLGLSIVKTIVEQHDGQLRVESPGEVGLGTKFIVSFPQVE
jgi:two-component system, OmpR family, phosphate regulon sensor histidine kinase PhoR